MTSGPFAFVLVEGDNERGLEDTQPGPEDAPGLVSFLVLLALKRKQPAPGSAHSPHCWVTGTGRAVQLALPRMDEKCLSCLQSCYHVLPPKGKARDSLGTQLESGT